MLSLRFERSQTTAVLVILQPSLAWLIVSHLPHDARKAFTYLPAGTGLRLIIGLVATSALAGVGFFTTLDSADITPDLTGALDLAASTSSLAAAFSFSFAATSIAFAASFAARSFSFCNRASSLAIAACSLASSAALAALAFTSAAYSKQASSYPASSGGNAV